MIPGSPLSAVLFDRDGTLIDDVPYCTDPARVRSVRTAAAALARLRTAGVRIGVITNQSGIGRGLISAEQADAVNARVEELLGPFDVWRLCPHAPNDGCRCRKPAPGMVLSAAQALGTTPQRVAVVGDIGADVGAAQSAGAMSVLVPTPLTLAEEIRAAPVVCADLLAAVRFLLGDRPS
ncbi:MAG: HAD-IIIA family hydrolase [Pseudonocardiales bacterium]|nr:HAD-IIIA family hydrolase [Pseudonocardiales bacterium]